jgi:heterodisulfide reductase subunit A
MKNIVIIGAGVAGLSAASILKEKGYDVTIIEKKAYDGGNVASWDRLFPDSRRAGRLIDDVKRPLGDGVTIHYDQSITSLVKMKDGRIGVKTDSLETIHADALLVASGFSLFDAHLKEEYGYGIYDNVYTQADLESMFNAGKVLTRSGDAPRRIGFVHCVGSRDEKVGNRYCSKVCCVTAVKQASEIKQLYPDAQVYCFYMDLRMFELPYEDMYFNAQKLYGVRFIRGRLCEAAEKIDKSVVLKVEDTLAGQTMNLSVDMLVLMAGMRPASDTARIATMLGLHCGKEGFLTPVDIFSRSNETEVDGVFLAGTCTGPKTIPQTIADARSAAIRIDEYLKKRKK